jgi:hypothetical protein
VFDTLPYNTPQKIGIIFYGLIIGAGAALLTSLGFGLVGLLLSLMGNAGWIHLGEYQPWMPIIGIEYGVVPAIVIGVVVCWKVCRSRLRSTPRQKVQGSDCLVFR